MIHVPALCTNLQGKNNCALCISCASFFAFLAFSIDSYSKTPEPSKATVERVFPSNPPKALFQFTIMLPVTPGREVRAPTVVLHNEAHNAAAATDLRMGGINADTAVTQPMKVARIDAVAAKHSGSCHHD
jgi:hypothetical protein